MTRQTRRILAAAGTLVLITASTLPVLALSSPSFVLSPLSMNGSFGGGDAASATYQLSISFSAGGGELSGTAVDGCIGYQCAFAGTTVFLPATLK
jgi:hypothetical protein